MNLSVNARVKFINAESTFIRQYTFHLLGKIGLLIWHNFSGNSRIFNSHQNKFHMQVFTKSEITANKINQVDSYDVKCFMEAPRKTGEEKPLSRIGAFELFTLFTADIIRGKQIFVR
jgi:hypothetical protein